MTSKPAIAASPWIVFSAANSETKAHKSGRKEAAEAKQKLGKQPSILLSTNSFWFKQ